MKRDAEQIESVLAVVVTYGERSEMCLTAASEALRQGAAVLIVDNGSAPEAAAALRAFAEARASVELVRSDHNRGSAGGFSLGITTAIDLGATYVWLLDDDSELAPDALEALVDAYRLLEDRSSAPLACFSHRTGNRFQSEALRSGSAHGVYPPPGSFMYFDVVTQLRRRGRAVGSTSSSGPRAPVAVPYGPYGGLFTRRETLRSVSRPDERFVLYEDDTDFTWRLRAAGVELWLVGGSTVDDADAKWSEASGGRGPERLLRSLDVTRRGLAVRNRSYFDRRRVTSWPLAARYLVNQCVYLAVLWATARRIGAMGDFRSIRSAARRGKRGDLETAGTDSLFAGS